MKLGKIKGVAVPLVAASLLVGAVNSVAATPVPGGSLAGAEARSNPLPSEVRPWSTASRVTPIQVMNQIRAAMKRLRAGGDAGAFVASQLRRIPTRRAVIAKKGAFASVAGPRRGKALFDYSISDIAPKGIIVDKDYNPPHGYWTMRAEGYEHLSYRKHLAEISGRLVKSTGIPSSRFGPPSTVVATRARGKAKAVMFFLRPVGTSTTRAVRRLVIANNGSVSEVSRYQ